jgi:hypothetical protein
MTIIIFLYLLELIYHIHLYLLLTFIYYLAFHILITINHLYFICHHYFFKFLTTNLKVTYLTKDHLNHSTTTHPTNIMTRTTNLNSLV